MELEYDATSLAQLSLGSFTHSSLQNLSGSIMDGERWCTDIFTSLQSGSSQGPGWDTQGHSVVPKPLFCCLCCVLRVVVLLKPEPPPPSEVF